MEIILRQNIISSNMIPSYGGHMKRLDLAGKKIGELTVIGYSHSHIQPSGQKRAMWDVECSCGLKKKVSTANLMHGSTVSCGHVGAQNRKASRLLPHNQAEKNYLYLSYRQSAAIRNIEFEISKDDFLSVIEMDCAYCGCAPSNSNTRKPRSIDGLPYAYNGVDRIDNQGAYKIGNIAPCCQKCNFMKGALSREEFISHIQRIFSHVEKRQK